MDQHVLYILIGVLNILTDLAAVVIPFFVMRNVQVAALKRWMVVGLFASRILYVFHAPSAPRTSSICLRMFM